MLSIPAFVPLYIFFIQILLPQSRFSGKSSLSLTLLMPVSNKPFLQYIPSQTYNARFYVTIQKKKHPKIHSGVALISPFPKILSSHWRKIYLYIFKNYSYRLDRTIYISKRTPTTYVRLYLICTLSTLVSTRTPIEHEIECLRRCCC